MKAQTALALVLIAAPAMAGDAQFHMPTTARAHQTEHLLETAAHAVSEWERRA